MLNDEALARYSRHILLPEIDIQGQLRLSNAKILLVGCGGLGCATALYLAASGIGHIHLIDPDEVELSNLQRQIAFTTKDVGQAKAACLARRLTELNCQIKVSYEIGYAGEHNLAQLLKLVDVVLDGSDNFRTRFLVNRFAYGSGTPLISAAVTGFQGQIMGVLSSAQSPCYQCLFPEDAQDTRQNCHEAGVFSPLVGVVASMQASEAMKYLLGFGSLMGQLLRIDGFSWQQKLHPVLKDPACGLCGTTP